MESEIQPNIPPGQQLPQTSIPVSPQTNWSKILLFTISGLIVVAGAVFAGIQIGKNQITNQQPITEQPTIFPTQIVANPTAIPREPNPTTNPTADWKTYTSVKDKYQILYPQDWRIDDTAMGTSLVISNPNKKYPDGTLTISAAQGQNSCDSDMNSAKNWNWQNLQDKSTTIGGMNGTELSGKTDYTNGIYYDRKFILIKGQNRCYTFDYWSYDGNQTNTLNQILSTLKFTN